MKQILSQTKTARRRMTERGFASIIVTTVLISVIGLILVGFSISVRRNQRETLDRQLSTQAFYAAETAVNKARADVVEQFKQTGKVTAVPDCTKAIVSANPGIVAPCVTIDSSLESMFYNSVEEGKDTYATVIPADPAGLPVNNLVFTWRPAQDTPNPQSGCNGRSGELPPRGSWPGSCAYGVLRLDISESDAAGNFNPNAFATSVILLPSDPILGGIPAQLLALPTHDPSGAGAYFVGADQCGSGNPAATFTDRWCSKQINLNGAASGKQYYVRMRSIYRNSAVDIQPRNGAAPVETSGQILIDATGKAQDVLRRIQVRVPVDPGNNNTFGAIESTGSICKRFAVAPVDPANPAAPNLWGGGSNGLCQP